MANAKLSGSLLAYKGPPSALAPAHSLSRPSEVFVDRPLANRFESVNSSSPAIRHRRSGPRVHFALAVCGIAATAAVGVFWFMHAAAQTGPTVAVRPHATSPSVSDAARVSTNPMAQLQTTIVASGKANKGLSATVSTALTDAPVQPVISAAIANSVVPSVETKPDVLPPAPSAEPRAAVAGSSAPAIDQVPAVAAARVEAPVQPALVPSMTTPSATPDPSPTAAAAPVSPQPVPAIAGSASAPSMQSAVARLSAKEVAALLARGDVMFGVGDIASARLFYERAAQGGDAQAALRLGESYDPAFLAWARLKGVSGDAVAAARWYLYARELGAAEAEVLLTRVAGTVESADHTHPATK